MRTRTTRSTRTARAAVTLGLALLVSAAPVGVVTAAPAGASGTGWSLVPTPSVPSSNLGLDAVSCPTPAFCAAVGQSTPDTTDLPLAEVFDGTTWAIEPTTAVGTHDNELAGVSCTGPSFCMAVGYAFDGDGNTQPLTQTWNGRTWTAATVPLLEDPLVRFYSVACTSPTACTAVGEYDTGSPDTTLTLAATWDGTSWSLVTTPNSGTSDNAFTSVSCPAAGSCTAVGTFYEGDGSAQNLVETESAGTWTVVTVPDVGSDDNFLASVSCPSAGTCTAVGSDNFGVTEHRPLLLTEQAGTWSLVTPPAQASTASNLSGVWCASATTCAAAGTYYDAGNTQQTVVMTEQAGTWSVVPSPNVGTGNNQLLAMACTPGQACTAVGEDDGTGGNGQALVLSAPGQLGYWLGASDGGVFTYGSASYQGSLGGVALSSPVVGLAATPDGRGYWEVNAAGVVFPFGTAQGFGSLAGVSITSPVVGMARTPDGGGYWLVSSAGVVYPYGDARSFGSLAGRVLDAPVVGMAATLDGGGYWLVASDGGIFAFGDAGFLGSMGGTPLNRPVVGMDATPDGGGYWLVASDGGIFAFGDAGFLGSTGGLTLNAPVVGMADTPDGAGYWLVASDGGIFSYGDAQFLGSTGGLHLVAPVVGMATPW